MVNGMGRARDVCRLVIVAIVVVVVAACGVVSKDARKNLETRFSTSTLTVYPVGVVRGSDVVTMPTAVASIVDGLKPMGFAAVEPATDVPEVRTVWRRNQQDMLNHMAGEVSAYVSRHPPKGQFALYAQYLLPAESEKILGILWVITDRDGRIAATGVMNNRDPQFVENNPTGRVVATTMLVDDVKQHLGGMMAKAGGRRAGS